MDELTIGNEKYFSSKKAAKVTGYAKDYVGQLCREGRVEARLVGRNWYVLESSIMEHRFGPTEPSSVHAAPSHKAPEPIREWEAPKYTSEPQQDLPLFAEKPYSGNSNEVIAPIVAVPENKDVVSDMQSAWQEWFKTQQNKEKELSDASAMLLPEGDEVVEQILPQKIEEYHVPLEPTFLYKADTALQAQQERQVEVEQTVQLHKRATPFVEATVLVERVYQARSTIQHPAPPVMPAIKSESIRTKSERPMPVAKTFKKERTSKTNLVANMLLVGAAGIIIAVTALAVTTMTQTETGSGNGFYKYINGVSTTK